MPSRTHPVLRSASSAWPHLLGWKSFFLKVGDLVDGRTAPPPKLTPEAIDVRQKMMGSLLAKYRTEMVTA
jgi:hypothetical protein